MEGRAAAICGGAWSFIVMLVVLSFVVYGTVMRMATYHGPCCDRYSQLHVLLLLLVGAFLMAAGTTMRPILIMTEHRLL